MSCFVRSFPIQLLVLLSGVVYSSVFAAEDDVVNDCLDAQLTKDGVNAAKIQKVFAIRNQAIVPIGDRAAIQFEKMIFRQDGSAAIGDLWVKAEREQVINSLDRTVQLTDNQKRRFDLAGEIDRRRFLSQVKAVSQMIRGGLDFTEEDQKAVRLLQAKATTGLLGPGSFFIKSIPTILANNQLALLNERKRSIHSGLIRNALRDFEARLTLSEQQRKSLTQIMLDEIPYDPASENGELLAARSERIMMMYRLSCFANEKIESLFDPVQWQKVRPMLEECYHYKEYLIERGLLDPDADVVEADQPAIRMKEPK